MFCARQTLTGSFNLWESAEWLEEVLIHAREELFAITLRINYFCPLKFCYRILQVSKASGQSSRERIREGLLRTKKTSTGNCKVEKIGKITKQSTPLFLHSSWCPIKHS